MAQIVWTIINAGAAATWDVLLFDAQGAPVGQEGGLITDPLVFNVSDGGQGRWQIVVGGESHFHPVSGLDTFSSALEQLNIDWSTRAVTSSEDTGGGGNGGGGGGGFLGASITPFGVLVAGGAILATALLLTGKKKG